MERRNTNKINKLKKDRIRFLIFGLGKWLLGESRALKVGINVGLFSRTS